MVDGARQAADNRDLALLERLVTDQARRVSPSVDLIVLGQFSPHTGAESGAGGGVRAGPEPAPPRRRRAPRAAGHRRSVGMPRPEPARTRPPGASSGASPMTTPEAPTSRPGDLLPRGDRGPSPSAGTPHRCRAARPGHPRPAHPHRLLRRGLRPDGDGELMFDEPGCLRFDVHRHTDDDTREIYVDQDAFYRDHRAAPHYPAWREVSAACVEPGEH